MRRKELDGIYRDVVAGKGAGTARLRLGKRVDGISRDFVTGNKARARCVWGEAAAATAGWLAAATAGWLPVPFLIMCHTLHMRCCRPDLLSDIFFSVGLELWGLKSANVLETSTSMTPLWQVEGFDQYTS